MSNLRLSDSLLGKDAYAVQSHSGRSNNHHIPDRSNHLRIDQVATPVALITAPTFRPLYEWKNSAGYPSPARYYLDNTF